MNRFSLRAALCALACASSINGAVAAEFHVNPDTGDNANPGTAAAPFKTVNKALVGRAPGDRVLLAPGVYREEVSVGAHGAERHPIVIESADPAHPAILSGADRITNWLQLAGSTLPEANHSHADAIFFADIPWVPMELFVGSRRQTNAREPNAGWWTAVSNGSTISSAALKGVAAPSLDGAQMFFFLVNGIEQELAPIKGWAGEPGGAVALEAPLFKGKPVAYSPGVDRFCLQNHLAFLDQPGEWVVQPSGRGARIFWWPPSKEALSRVEATRRPTVVDLTKAGYVTLRGLEICHAGSRGGGSGISTNGGPDEKGDLRTWLVIESCSIYQNLRYGITLSGSKFIHVHHCLIVDNGNGLSCSASHHLLFEENEIAGNQADGVDISAHSANVMLLRNVIHHHSRFAHPDNFQTFRGVDNVVLDSNVMAASAQGVHTEETTSLIARNNIFAGSNANLFYVSADPPGKGFTLERNTFALFPRIGVVVEPKGHKLENNVFDVRSARCGYGGPAGPNDLASTNNLFFNADTPQPIVMLNGQGRDLILRELAHVRAMTRLEAGSVAEDPRFACAPERVGRLDSKRLADCTGAKLALSDEDRSNIVAGNHVEIDFDGVDRVVKEVADKVITIDPPLPEPPLSAFVMANWGAGPVRPIDLRSPSGHGSNLDFEAFMRADFDGNGKRAVPPWPEGIPSPRKSP